MTVLLCQSCSCTVPNREWSSLHDAYLKKDVESYSGQVSCVYRNRIYYVSNELGEDGVYSMDYEGGNIKLEFTASKIVKLIVKDNKIYYIELSNVDKKRNEMYGLYEYNKVTQETSVVMEGDDTQSVHNVSVISEDLVFARVYEGIGSSKIYQSYLYEISDKGHTPYVEIKKIATIERNSSILKIIPFDGYFLTTLEYKYNYDIRENCIGDEQDSVYDIETGETLMPDIFKYGYYNIKVIHTNRNNVYTSNGNQLVIYTKEKLHVKKRVVFDGINEDERLDYAIESNGKLYLIFTNKDKTKKLFAMNMETHEYAELMDFDSRTVLINIQDGGILYAKGKKVYFKNFIDKGLGETKYEIKFDGNIVYNNIFEVAANWLFIYDRGQPYMTTPLELLYKVNLETKEVIEVVDDK